MKEEVFISYAWTKTKIGKGHEEIVSSIERALEKTFKVVIDKKDIKYKDNIKNFEERLGRGSKVILVISDKFLKSKHCMYEVLKIKERGDVYSRIFPIVMKDALIYDSNKALDYIKYWENEAAALNKKLKSLKTLANTSETKNDLDNYEKFRSIFDNFRGLLGNMNTLNPEIHEGTNFKELINALNGFKSKEINKFEKEFGTRINRTKRLFESAIRIIEQEINDEKIKADEILEKIKFFYQQCKNQTFQIAVMSIVKSGKSTFLNALLGDEFLPMSNVPETSVPVKISHSINGRSILIDGKSKIEGTEKIKKYIETVNKEKRDKGFKYEVEFNLQASFKALEDKQMTDIKLEIIDTPGFGEALTELTVGKSIDQSNTELIDKIGAIIYLLDYTKLKTKDENQVLDKLTEMRRDILEKIKDRLFFVINKIDEEDRNSLLPDDAIDYVFNLIKEKVPNIIKQHFFTLSASHALLSRLIINGNATNGAKHDFGKIAFGYKANKMDDSSFKEAALQILQSSNITLIENNVINYIFENRSRIFLESLEDNLKRLLQEFKNKFIITAEGALNRTIEEIEDLELKIEAAKKKQESIQEEAEKFETEIKDWIEVEFKTFEKNIVDNIDSAFSAERTEEKKKWRNRIIPDWVKRIQNEIKRAETLSKNQSKGNVAFMIKRINTKVNTELSESFTQFKKELEAKLIKKQEMLLDNLKNTINSLAKEFEGTLKKVLHVEYENTELRLDSSDFDRTLMEADSFIERFINSQSKIGEVIRERTIYKPGSWCGRGKMEIETFKEPVLQQENTISKDGLEIFWKEVIDNRNANAKRITHKLLESNIKQQIKNARKKFNDYVEDYLITIQEQKLRLSNDDKETIAIRLNNLKSLNNSISTLISQI